jgi:hypothetical protein
LCMMFLNAEWPAMSLSCLAIFAVFIARGAPSRSSPRS